MRTKEHATDAAFRLEAALDAALVGEQHAVALSASRAEQLKMLAAARAKEQTAAAQKQAALHTEHALSQAKVSKLAATVVGLQRELAASAAARDRMAARESQAVARLHKLELAQAVGPVSSARPHAADAGATAASTGMRGASSAPPSAPSSSTAAHLELVGEVAELRKHAANADGLVKYPMDGVDALAMKVITIKIKINRRTMHIRGALWVLHRLVTSWNAISLISSSPAWR